MFDAVVVGAVAVAALVLFVTEWIPASATALGVSATLMVSGVLTPVEGLAGFSNDATITVFAMLALAAGVEKTGLVSMAAHGIMSLSRRTASRFRAVLLMVCGGASSILNNTPVVAIMIPVVGTVSARLSRSPSRFLIPMAYASTLGGMLTLVGTSTTVLASSVWDDLGGTPFTMFQFTHIGIVVFVAGGLYLLWASERLLPERHAADAIAGRFQRNDYLTEAVVGAASPLVGQDPAVCDLKVRYDADVLSVMREGRWGRPHHGPIQGGDVLLIQAGRDVLLGISDMEHISLRPDVEHWLPENTIVVEAAVAPGSLLDGRSLQEVRLRGRYAAVVLAVRHRPRLPGRRLSRMRLNGGDVLLLRGTPSAIRQLEDSYHLVVPTELDAGFRRNRIPVIVAILAAVISLAATGLLPLVVAALAGVVAAVVTGCVRLHEFQDAVRWDIVLLMAGLIPLGTALVKTGIAQAIASTLGAAVIDWHPLAIVATLYLVTMLLTEIASNNATVVLMLPIGSAVASQVGLEPLPVAVAITFAASLAFMTPIGYQTHMMVYGPGEYRFSDYFRIGAPLNLLTGIIAIAMIDWTWPFRP